MYCFVLHLQKESSEFAQIYNGFLGHAVVDTDNATVRVPKSGKLPETVDWRTKGVVSEIKNQVSTYYLVVAVVVPV